MITFRQTERVKRKDMITPAGRVRHGRASHTVVLAKLEHWSCAQFALRKFAPLINRYSDTARPSYLAGCEVPVVYNPSGDDHDVVPVTVLAEELAAVVAQTSLRDLGRF